MYVCAKCEVSNDAKSWNEKTESMYGTTWIYPIENNAEKDGCYFVCPSCGSKEHGNSILIYKEGAS